MFFRIFFAFLIGGRENSGFSAGRKSRNSRFLGFLAKRAVFGPFFGFSQKSGIFHVFELISTNIFNLMY